MNSKRYLLVKHSEGWNVDRVYRWMENSGHVYDWCYPASGQPLPNPAVYDGVIVFGGACSANDCSELSWIRAELRFIEQCVELDIPFFGICLGAQMLARVLGARIGKHPTDIREIGHCKITPTVDAGEFLIEPLHVMQWHSEGFELPAGCRRIASSEAFPNQAFRVSDRLIGVQFHPEVNPSVLRIWHERNRKRRPGQLNDADRAAQLADAVRYDASISTWLDNFLTRWTDPDTKAT